MGINLEKEGQTAQDANLVFALDIGTRSVVGVVGRSSNLGFEVVDYERIYHKHNAMRDGQIEDIGLTTSAVRQVKDILESRNSIVFTKVAVAAAGRALKTVRATYQQELDENEIITLPLIHSLEYAGVSLAQEIFFEENKEHSYGDDFFCAGYSVVTYNLDDYILANLEGHKGRNVSLDVIAAFLPRNVVRSLYTVTSMNGLDVDSLTLEPIAAINAIVPKDIRMLNIAIVDIGAGTSDVAISKNGSVVAYGMATIAGDEVTEAIMRAFLTDFDTAERIKISFSNNQPDISYDDILGITHQLNYNQINKAISPCTDTLCQEITDTILRINETSPVAVFLVGGGSQIPGLCEKISKNLDVPISQVGVGGKQLYKNITLCSDQLCSPEFITPIGIGLTSSLYKGCNFFSITVNNRKVMLINNESMKVLDALLLAGIKPAKLIGLSAPGITFTLNGERISKRGAPPQMGVLTVNGVSASIDTEIKQGDVIEALSAKNGEAPLYKISDIAKEIEMKSFVFNGSEVTIKPSFLVNDKMENDEYVLMDGDNITYNCPENIRDIINYLKKDLPADTVFYINGEYADLDSPVATGDIVSTKISKEKTDTNVELTYDHTVNVCVNGTWYDIGVKKGQALMVADTLRYVEIDTNSPQGILVVRMNGGDAGFADEVKDGDNVEIGFSG